MVVPKSRLSSIVILMPIGIAIGIGMAALCGCATAPAPVVVAPTVAPTVRLATASALTVEADNALKAAEQTIIETRVQRAVWTAATEQLDHARAAAKTFNSDLTLKHAREAIALCQLSLQQKQSPPVVW